jgi:hypothetical protein
VLHFSAFVALTYFVFLYKPKGGLIAQFALNRLAELFYLVLKTLDYPAGWLNLFLPPADARFLKQSTPPCLGTTLAASLYAAHGVISAIESDYNSIESIRTSLQRLRTWEE